jgi:hypothetical protein
MNTKLAPFSSFLGAENGFADLVRPRNDQMVEKRAVKGRHYYTIIYNKFSRVESMET